MRPAGQSVGAKGDSFQVPANRTFKPDPRIPLLDDVRLIKYDFEKYGKAAERKRLLDRWTREVGRCHAEVALRSLCSRGTQ